MRTTLSLSSSSKGGVLVADIGGTNTRLALYVHGEIRRKAVYPTAGHPSLGEILNLYIKDAKLGSETPMPEVAALAAAGVAKRNCIQGTNLPWDVDGEEIKREFRLQRVTVMNDLAAAAWGVLAIGKERVVKIGGGEPDPSGNMAVLGPGTGLGEAMVVLCPGGPWVIATEGGHTDFAPTSPEEMEILSFLQGLYGHVSAEKLISGQGLVNLLRFFSNKAPSLAPLLNQQDPAAAVTMRALDGDQDCASLLRLFCSLLGAEAGNLALKAVATGGVFIAGGIAPRIVDFLKTSPFRKDFEAKGRMSYLLAQIPTYVVMEPDLGLIGAGFQAQQSAGRAT